METIHFGKSTIALKKHKYLSQNGRRALLLFKYLLAFSIIIICLKILKMN